ncbi:MAG: hypothetical protein IT371_31725 [Deltaproteobacteria bacterium]|nr:hypothetical protein [Deltaproteobacteria bacterium]
MADGRVALVAGGEHAWWAYRLDVSGAHVRFTGATSGLGQVLDQPAMGERWLRLPVLRAGRLHYEELGADRFRGGGECGAL